MTDANFQVLGIKIPSGRYNYHDEGYVSSIREAVGNLCLRKGEETPNISKDALGFYAGLGLDVHIFYVKRPTIPLDIQNRAHEETHAVDYIGGLDVLSAAILENQRVRINLKEVDDEDVRAQLGSLYALYSRGISPRKLGRYLTDTRLTKARKIWNQSREPRRTFFPFFWRRDKK